MKTKEEKIKHGFLASAKDVRLWAGLLLPPASWAIQLQAAYLLIEYGCSSGRFLPVHAASAMALAAAAAGTLLSWSEWQRSGGEWKNEEEGLRPRRRFMGLLGMLLGVLFSLLIFAQWLPVIMEVPCDK